MRIMIIIIIIVITSTRHFVSNVLYQIHIEERLMEHSSRMHVLVNSDYVYTLKILWQKFLFSRVSVDLSPVSITNALWLRRII